jgi:hypothetical protein
MLLTAIGLALAASRGVSGPADEIKAAGTVATTDLAGEPGLNASTGIFLPRGEMKPSPAAEVIERRRSLDSPQDSPQPIALIGDGRVESPEDHGATFVSPVVCGECHPGHYQSWSMSLHANTYRPPVGANILAPWAGDVTVTDPGRGLTMTVELNSQGGSGQFTVRLYADDAKTLPLLEGNPAVPLVRVSGGHASAVNANDGSLSRGGGVAGESPHLGPQLYHVSLDGSEYILPIQWNPTPDLDNRNGGWVSFNLQDWITAGGSLIIAPVNSEAVRCAGCHRTGIQTVAVVGGNYVFNDDAEVLGNVNCQVCHAPGSLHVADHENNIMMNVGHLHEWQKLDFCGSCHSRGSSVSQVNGTALGYPYRDDIWPSTFRHGDVWSDFFVEGGEYWPDGKTATRNQQHYEEHLHSTHFLQGGMDCLVCHDMHFTEVGLTGAAVPPNEHLLRKPARGNAPGTLCYDCHQPSMFPNGTEAEVREHTGHPLGNMMPDCIDCHMPATGKSAVHYDIHDHTFEMLKPDVHTLGLNMPNACAIICHRGAGPEGPAGLLDSNIHLWNEATDLAIADYLLGRSPKQNRADQWFYYR